MSDWNQWNGDRKNTAHRPGLEGPERRLEEAWTAEVGELRGSPVLDDRSVYVGTDRGLAAFDRDDGYHRWTADLFGEATTPVLTHDRVVVATREGTVYGLEAASGEAVWEESLEGPLESTPTIADGVVYVGDADGVAALEAHNGERRWYRTDGESEDDLDPDDLEPDPDADDENGLGGGTATLEVDGLETGGGDTIGPVVGAPAVADGHVYVGSRGGTVHALEAASGERVWTAPTNGDPVGGLTAADGRVYVADDAGMLVAMDGETGQSWFTYRIREAFTSSPTVLEDTLFVAASDGYLHVTDTEFGNRKLRGYLFSKKGLSLDGVARTSPVVVGDVGMVVDSTRAIYAFDATDPDFTWHLPLEAPVVGTPAVAPERLFVAREDGHLSALSWR
ncbi:outer membrane protein assembly factor BamB family protein [Natrialbaceae archaeon A-gly3]